MKNYVILFLVIFSLASCNTLSSESYGKYDLSTPDNTFESFVNASKTGDLVELDKMLAPRIKKMLSQGKFTIKQYAKIWSKYPIKEKSKAKLFKSQLASIDIVIIVNGKEHKTHVSLIEINGKWLWNEK